MQNDAEFRNGMQYAMQAWGTLCGGKPDCSECPIGRAKGADISCQDFAAKFPAMFVSALEKATSEETYTYYNEFCNRFPNAAMPPELVATAFCRKCLFEGDFECAVENNVDACTACWLKPYVSDVESATAPQQAQSVSEGFDIDF